MYHITRKDLVFGHCPRNHKVNRSYAIDSSHLQYRKQDSVQTLAEGLAEYHLANEGKIARLSDLPPESVAFFYGHDVCHVIFGLDATLEEEVVTEARTLLSCNLGLAR